MGDRISLHEEYATFKCPGCNSFHTISIKRWNWNGNASRPTFTPSILEKSGHYARQGEDCWCTYNADPANEPTDFKCHICHSFVTDGKIQYLGDCTHEMAGQTVEIPEWE